MANLNMIIPNYPKLKRSGLKKAIIHNTAGNASAKQEAIRLKAKSQWQNGNAHKFIDDIDCVTVVDMAYVSYNCGNWDMNCNSISYEICKSRGDKSKFLKAEQNTFKIVAYDLKKYGKKSNIIELHRNIVATACPHRSQELHGSGKKCLDYFIKEVNKHMTTTVAKPTSAKKEVKYPSVSGEKVMAKNHTYKVVSDVLNVRKEPSTSAAIYRKRLKGGTFTSRSYLDKNGHRWLSYVTADLDKYWIAESTLKNKKNKFVKDITN